MRTHLTLIHENDEFYMKKCFELASKALGRTEPNPLVGAVIVKNYEIVGSGYHHKAGEAHAEINALREAGAAAGGSTVYVNLEPCCHFGRTPPCTDALIRAGVKRVVIASLDPNFQIAGQGAEVLRQAGIEVDTGVLADQALKLNEIYFKYIQTRRPFVLLKAAMTLDGKIATASGDAKWVSNEKSRQFAHELRNKYQGVLVGIGTVTKDNPRLNIRLAKSDARDPIRVVLDTNLRISEQSNLLQTAWDQPLLIFCRPNIDEIKRKKLTRLGAEIVSVATDDDYRISLTEVLEELGRREITSLLVEGGSEVHASFLNQGLADKVCWFISPKLVGGRTAPTSVGGLGKKYMQDAIQLKNISYQQFGEDLCLTGYIEQ